MDSLSQSTMLGKGLTIVHISYAEFLTVGALHIQLQQQKGVGPILPALILIRTVPSRRYPTANLFPFPKDNSHLRKEFRVTTGNWEGKEWKERFTGPLFLWEMELLGSFPARGNEVWSASLIHLAFFPLEGEAQLVSLIIVRKLTVARSHAVLLLFPSEVFLSLGDGVW